MRAWGAMYRIAGSLAAAACVGWWWWVGLGVCVGGGCVGWGVGGGGGGGSSAAPIPAAHSVAGVRGALRAAHLARQQRRHHLLYRLYRLAQHRDVRLLGRPASGLHVTDKRAGDRAAVCPCRQRLHMEAARWPEQCAVAMRASNTRRRAFRRNIALRQGKAVSLLPGLCTADCNSGQRAGSRQGDSV